MSVSIFSKTIKSIKLLLAMVSIGLVTQSVMAGDENPSGVLQGTGEYVADYISFPFLGAALVSGSLEGAITLSESQGTGLFDGVTFSMKCIVTAVIEPGEVPIIESLCTGWDAAGDAVYITAERQGLIGEGHSGQGRMTLEGGTGKYENAIFTACPYQVTYGANGQVTIAIQQCAWETL